MNKNLLASRATKKLTSNPPIISCVLNVKVSAIQIIKQKMKVDIKLNILLADIMSPPFKNYEVVTSPVNIGK
jgi:hypothetical protein